MIASSTSRRRRFGALALLTILVGAGSAPSGAQTLSVRDVSSGRSISAELRLYGPAADARTFPAPLRRALRASGATPDLHVLHPPRRAELALAEGAWAALFSADGYRPLTTVIEAGKDRPQEVTVWLDPLTQPDYLRLADQHALSLSERLLLDGHVLDAEHGIPIVGARVEILGETAQSMTDARGYFAIELAVAPLADGKAPAQLALNVTAAGFPVFTQRGIARSAGGQRLLLELGADRREGHSEHRLINPRLGDVARSTSDSVDAESLPLVAADKLLVLDPPDSIRVGFNAGNATCCGNSCTTVSVKSLETYVAQGIDDEWISSWTQQSLRAGTIAYRSYGAYHVGRGVYTNYDICSSACCQVNDNNSPGANGAAAGDATLGLMLERAGVGPNRSEYSAENNAWDDPDDGLSCTNADLSCGDGDNGSPAAPWLWPCMPDAVGAGHGCFGHGRGMSQWGTQRWSLAPNSRRWKWIANHYYNDNNNESGGGTGNRTAKISSPVSIDSAAAVTSPDPAAGASFGIALNANNRADGIHDFILVGASIYAVGPGYISDPANDAAIDLAEGVNTPSRQFVVPPATPAGLYDLYVSLYLDVDENGAISSEDLALDLKSYAAAVRVVGDRIFYDGYQ